MKKKPIEELIKSCLKALKQENYKSEVLDKHRRNLNGIKEFMGGYSLHLYSENVGESYKMALIEAGIPLNHKFKEKKSTINLLNDILNEVPMRKKRVSRKVYPLPGEIGQQAEIFLDYFKATERPHDRTLIKYRSVLSRFTVRMKADKIAPSTLNSFVINQFMSSCQNIRFHVSIPLRRFLRYLYDKDIILTDLSIPLYQIKKNYVEKLPSVYNIDEVKLMENAINRNTNKGKRNYAIFLLASRLGLRASDISFIQFSNIDWDRNLIRLQQYKTKKDIELPLLKVVGEAIVDYIRYSRPKSDSKYIFLSGRAPYQDIGASSIGYIINEIIRKAGVYSKDRHAGSHSLRHSLATHMIEQGELLPIVSETLGHNSSTTTMKYLAVDISGLINCSLHVPPVPESFYMQRGGAFYE